MALRGNLRDFSLPDVFQLVQLSGKTGVLRIQGPEAEGSIWFRDGEVFFAQSNWRREQLGERLVAAQRITPAALARALELREAEPEGGRRLGEILVNEGYITPQVLETFVQEQIQDTIFDLMRWDEGDFDFEVLPDVVREDIGLAVSVENIVMEGSRRLEEWQRIKKKVPSTEMVFKMATAPGEGTFEISLKPVEWALLLLIDGTRSVRELAVETHSTDFDVARVVYGLFSAGLLEVPADDEVERLRADRSRREDKRAILEAERAAREQAQMDEALDLEAQLTAEAEARRVAEEPVQAEVAEEVALQESQVEPEAELPEEAELAERHVPEEPEFLAAAAESPSSDDMAVFEQMMASVLSPQAEGEEADEAPEQTPELQAIPDVSPDQNMLDDFEPMPEIIPEFDITAEMEPSAGLVPRLDEDSGFEPAAEFEPDFQAAPEAEPVYGLEPGFDQPLDESGESSVASVFVPGLDFFPEPPVAPAFEPDASMVTDTFEADATFVQYPAAYEQEPDQGLFEAGQSTAAPAVDLADLTIAELEALTAQEPQAPATTGDFEVDLRSLGLGEYPEELLQAGVRGENLLQPEGPGELPDTGLSADLLMPETPTANVFEVETAPDAVPEDVFLPPDDTRLPMSEIEAGRGQDETPQQGDDLDSLLASLGVENAASEAADAEAARAGVISSGTDFGAEDEADSGYISTDAFLAEFDDAGLSSGLGDELTALTGGATARSRPVATVNRLPEAGEGQILHRDQMVDRTLLEKIIEGIENL